MSIYFDHAATTGVLPEAAKAAFALMTEDFGNPSSRHHRGTHANELLTGYRKTLAQCLGASPAELHFTSGGTESDNWAIHIAKEAKRRIGKHIITTAVEHNAILAPCKYLEQQGYEVTYIPTDKTGHINPQQVADALRDDTILVSMMLVNNETGVLFPVAEVAQLMKAKQSKALLHTDAVQGFCKVPCNVKTLGVDMLSLSAHKIGGMKGTGALYVRKGIQITPLILGGGQEQGLRSGTEATSGIAAFATACQHTDLEKNAAAMQALKTYALDTLPRKIPALHIISSGDAPQICTLALAGYPSEMLVRSLSDAGICVSSGSACHKGKASHVFQSFHLPPNLSLGLLRLSFSANNTQAEIDALADALLNITKTRIARKG